MAFIVAHEFGHSMDTAHYSGTSSDYKKAENFANNYAKQFFVPYNALNIDMSNVKVN